MQSIFALTSTLWETFVGLRVEGEEIVFTAKSIKWIHPLEFDRRLCPSMLLEFDSSRPKDDLQPDPQTLEDDANRVDRRSSLPNPSGTSRMFLQNGSDSMARHLVVELVKETVFEVVCISENVSIDTLTG